MSTPHRKGKQPQGRQTPQPTGWARPLGDDQQVGAGEQRVEVCLQGSVFLHEVGTKVTCWAQGHRWGLVKV